MFYQPSPDLFVSPERVKVEAKEINLVSADGTKLWAWHLKLQQRESFKPKALLLFFHGNAQNMSAHYLNTIWLLKQGLEVIVFSYRGYGKSEGKPSPEGTVMDGLAALEYSYHLAKEENIPLAVWGQSLGGAIAMQSLIEFKRGSKQVQAAIIDSSFLSYKREAQYVLKKKWFTWPFQWLAYLLVSDAVAPKEIQELAPTPLLVIHGESDKVVDYKLGKNIFEQAGQPKEFLSIPQGEHIDVSYRESGRFRKNIMEFLSKNLHITGDTI